MTHSAGFTDLLIIRGLCWRMRKFNVPVVGLPSCHMADEFIFSRVMLKAALILSFRIVVCAHLEQGTLKFISFSSFLFLK